MGEITTRQPQARRKVVLVRMRHHQNDLEFFETMVRDQEDGGSNPLAPTNFIGTSNLQHAEKADDILVVGKTVRLSCVITDANRKLCGNRSRTSCVRRATETIPRSPFIKDRHPPNTCRDRWFRANGTERLGTNTKRQFPRRVRGIRRTGMALRAPPDLR